MKSRWRSGFGLAQIMALLVVVLPTMVFAVTFLIDYWRIMQVDYKLKLLANYVAERANNQEDLSNFSSSDKGYCPPGTSLVFSNRSDAPNKGEINIYIQYRYNGSYIKNKMLATEIHTYSYHDRNMTITGTCQ